MCRSWQRSAIWSVWHDVLGMASKAGPESEEDEVRKRTEVIIKHLQCCLSQETVENRK